MVMVVVEVEAAAPAACHPVVTAQSPVLPLVGVTVLGNDAHTAVVDPAIPATKL